MMEGFLLVPPFPKDETITSLLERTASYNRGGTLSTECARLLKRRRPLLDTVPCSTGRFCDAFGSAYGDAKRVLKEHTLFDFYACGINREQVTVFRDRLVKNSRGPLRPSRLPLFFTCSEQECFHCTDCDEQNLRERGFTFVYRQHAAPYVEVCPWHGTLLRPADEKVKLYDHQCRATGSGLRKVIQEFAVRVSQSVAASWHQSEYQRDALISQLTAEHWISENGRCAVSAFLLAFHKKFDKAFRDERLRILCSEPRYAEAALRALLRPDRNVHPIWCVLFKWIADVTHHLRVSRQPSVKAQQPSPKPSLQEQLNVLRSSASVRKASATLGISEQTLLGLSSRYGIPVKTRPKRIFETERRQIAAYIEKGVPPLEIAALCGVSLSTVYRLSASAPNRGMGWRETQSARRCTAARNAWLTVIESNPTSTVTELRHLRAADWSYLYRYDRSWLEQHSPRRTAHRKGLGNTSSPFLLSVVVDAIAAAAQKCASGDSVPVRRSGYRLQAMTGISEYGLSRLFSLDLSGGVYALLETQSSFIARRLRWIAAISKDVVHQPVWRLAKAAGLRVYSITSVVYNQASQKHTQE